ncbi:MAG: penicillin acylase family protein [Bacteroidota bacterium]
MKKILGRLLLGLVVLIGLLVLGGYLFLRQSLPTLDGERSLTGLTAPVSIDRDSLGVVHVHASTRPDAAFALGFVHAQERRFQMDLLRRAAAGELAALLGADLVSTDRVLRPHLFRQRAAEVYAGLPSRHREVVDAYAMGVNAGTEALGARPFEYAVLRQAPEPWRPEDAFLAAYAMVLDLQRSDLDDELSAFAMEAVLPPALVRFLAPGGDEWDAPLQGEAIVAPSPPPSDSLGGWRPGPAGDDTFEAGYLAALRADAERVGSNNWAVAGERTASGSALVANDMHLGLGLPHIWFRASVTVPDSTGEERTVSGVTLPGTPLVVVGSNGDVAWGFTNSYGDYIDLVRLVTEPGLPNLVQTDSGTVAVDTLRETIRVAHGEPVDLAIPMTPWGPVLFTDGRGDRYAVQWGAHRAEATNLTLLDLETARTLDDAMAVANRSGIPAQNFVAGDRGGRIGWTLAGQIPNREGRIGRRPVDSTDPNARWDGFLAPDDVPRVVAPADGLLWTANSRVVDGEALRLIGDGGYAHGARARQIRDRLRALSQPATEADMLAIQLDDEAVFVERWHGLLTEVLADAPLFDGRDAARDRLGAWTAEADADDPAYGLVRRFRQTLGAAVASALFRDAQAVWSEASSLPEPALWRLATERPDHLRPMDLESWDMLLLDAAMAAIEDSPATWGEENAASIEHPMADALPLLGRFLRLPEDPLDGDAWTPRVARPGFGASQRMAVSPGREAEGILHMPGGQSGHPLSPFWDAGHDAWVEGRPLPFLPGPSRHQLCLWPSHLSFQPTEAQSTPCASR